MISAYYPYPVSHKPPRRPALQPHIYSPSESPNAMYPLHPSSPSYAYSAYEPYYPKDSSSWPTFYPRSSLLPDAVNPKVIIHPSQPVLDTPSSTSSHSVLTPSSPFAQRHVDHEFESMDFDEFDGDDEDYVDSDFADEMEGIDESSPVYGPSAPHVIKSTSALEGALGDPPSYHDTHLGVFAPTDRRLSASVPGYHRSAAGTHQRWTEASPAQLTSSSSTSLFAPSFTPPPQPPYAHMSSSSLAGAFASPVPSPPRPPNNHFLPILQPQPIRPIPPIPLADLTSSASERSPGRLSPLPLLCQPVSDAVRYQLKERPASGGGGVGYGDGENAGSICHGVISAAEAGPFAQGMPFCQHHSSVDQKMYSCGCITLPMRWH